MLDYWLEKHGDPMEVVKWQYPEHLNDPVLRTLAIQYYALHDGMVQRLKELVPEEDLDDE